MEGGTTCDKTKQSKTNTAAAATAAMTAALGGFSAAFPASPAGHKGYSRRGRLAARVTALNTNAFPLFLWRAQGS